MCAKLVPKMLTDDQKANRVTLLNEENVFKFVIDVYYVDDIERLKKSFLRMRRKIAATSLLHPDNAPSHTAQLVREFLVKDSFAMPPQPLSSFDYFVFPQIKIAFKGNPFDGIEVIQTNVTNALNEVLVEVFQSTYSAWKNRWHKSVETRW